MEKQIQPGDVFVCKDDVSVCLVFKCDNSYTMYECYSLTKHRIHIVYSNRAKFNVVAHISIKDVDVISSLLNSSRVVDVGGYIYNEEIKRR